ncbi:MAG: Rsd/AlgQ family anti-sigma factor [Candidatus Competibacteraceae bacterium]|nr:Rsd/AlgQ family anti-sigma factor [Candidatus Competibacteraceae bacterium]
MNATIVADPVHAKALSDLVAKLLAARQTSLILYNKLAALKPFRLAEPVQQHVLRRFRQALVDYLALGPFQVYRVLEDLPADSPYRQARELARQCYADIARTTQAALEFHDRYDGDQLSEPVMAKLDAELSRLGEQLADRIELEDRIVAAVLDRNGSDGLGES